jgi:hypothetical protein
VALALHAKSHGLLVLVLKKHAVLVQTLPQNSGALTGFYRVRFLDDDEQKPKPKKNRDPKYLQPKDTGCHLYLPPLGGVNWQAVFRDLLYRCFSSKENVKQRGLQGASLGKELRGPRMTLCVVAVGADSYHALFALAEFDPEFTSRVIVLADRGN